VTARGDSLRRWLDGEHWLPLGRTEVWALLLRLKQRLKNLGPVLCGCEDASNLQDAISVVDLDGLIATATLDEITGTILAVLLPVVDAKERDTSRACLIHLV
jgi:hypothetical protein